MSAKKVETCVSQPALPLKRCVICKRLLAEVGDRLGHRIAFQQGHQTIVSRTEPRCARCCVVCGVKQRGSRAEAKQVSA